MSHLGFAANRLITSNAAVAFSSRIVTLERNRVEMIRFPMTSSASSRSSYNCWEVRPQPHAETELVFIVTFLFLVSPAGRHLPGKELSYALVQHLIR